MSTGSFAASSSDHNTVHYALPYKGSISANTSINSEGGRSAHIRFPTVTIHQQHQQQQSPRIHSSPGSSRSSTAQSAQYSATVLQYENMKHRCKMLDAENQRLMRIQNDVVEDANRRVNMHINEIRMIKEENKKLTSSNKELRDLCVFLDEDRLKARRLAREWQKFGKYTSHVMKQEIQVYHGRINELETKATQSATENEELRQLCLYLDEQRQQMLNKQCDEEESEDLGCGSSERSSESDHYKMQEDLIEYNMQKENTLRLISEQVQTSQTSDEQSTYKPRDTEKLLNYIKSLESRIKHLEMAQNQSNDTFWSSASNLESDPDEKTIIEKWDENPSPPRTYAKMMQISTTSTMTSSGTTYGSSETDAESAVYVMGDEIDASGNLEVRTLNKIEEEKEYGSLEKLEDSSHLPPPCAPLSASTLSVGRLSMNSDDFLSAAPSLFDNSLARSASASHNSSINYSPIIHQNRSNSCEKTSPLSDAIKILKIKESAAQAIQKDVRKEENAIVHHICQVAWDKLAQPNNNVRPTDISAV